MKTITIVYHKMHLFLTPESNQKKLVHLIITIIKETNPATVTIRIARNDADHIYDLL